MLACGLETGGGLRRDRLLGVKSGCLGDLSDRRGFCCSLLVGLRPINVPWQRANLVRTWSILAGLAFRELVAVIHMGDQNEAQRVQIHSILGLAACWNLIPGVQFMPWRQCAGRADKTLGTVHPISLIRPCGS